MSRRRRAVTALLIGGVLVWLVHARPGPLRPDTVVAEVTRTTRLAPTAVAAYRYWRDGDRSRTETIAQQAGRSLVSSIEIVTPPWVYVLNPQRRTALRCRPADYSSVPAERLLHHHDPVWWARQMRTAGRRRDDVTAERGCQVFESPYQKLPPGWSSLVWVRRGDQQAVRIETRRPDGSAEVTLVYDGVRRGTLVDRRLFEPPPDYTLTEGHP